MGGFGSKEDKQDLDLVSKLTKTFYTTALIVQWHNDQC